MVGRGRGLSRPRRARRRARVRSPGSGADRAYGCGVAAGRPGELEIVEHQAAVVRRILAAYVAGKSPRATAGELNAEDVLLPRGNRWAAVTINGSRKRGRGILTNPLYDGVLVWNRVRMLKNPDTGRRTSRPNPEADWHRARAEHLRIVDRILFAQGVRMKAEAGEERPPDHRRPKHLLSGLPRCAACSAMSVKDRHYGRLRIACATMKESGSCHVRRVFYADEIERGTVVGLGEKLRGRPLLDAYVRAHTAE